MLELNDPIWKGLAGGYGEPCDANKFILKLENDMSDDDQWHEFWGEMYHQGDVGIASYAVVPHLVRIMANNPKKARADTFMYLAMVEDSRKLPHNPDLPDWLAASYHTALIDALGLIKECLPLFANEHDRKNILCFAAQMAGMENLMVLIDQIEDDDHARRIVETM